MMGFFTAFVRNGRLTPDEPSDFAEVQVFKAYVRNGHLELDEPTDLPEGASVKLVSADTVVWWGPLDPNTPRLPSSGSNDEPVCNGAALIQQLTASIAEADAGETFDFAEVLAALRAGHAAHEASDPAVKTAAPLRLMKPVQTQKLKEPLKALVRNRRLVLDAPMELPNGSLVELVSLDDVLATGGYLLNEEELAALDSELDASFEEETSGQLIDAEDAIVELKSLGDGSLPRPR
jgi:hypothetical protein